MEAKIVYWSEPTNELLNFLKEKGFKQIGYDGDNKENMSLRIDKYKKIFYYQNIGEFNALYNPMTITKLENYSDLVPEKDYVISRYIVTNVGHVCASCNQSIDITKGCQNKHCKDYKLNH